MNKAEIERYFQEYIFGFIKNDIQREIDLAAKGDGGGNFLAALGLLCYTELMGEIYLHKPNIAPAERFNAFFDYMGIAYKKLREQLENKGISVYHKFRCGMAHTYFAKDCDIYMVYRGSPETGIIDLSDGKYLFIVQKYFEDFMAASKRLYEELSAKRKYQATINLIPHIVEQDRRNTDYIYRSLNHFTHIPPGRDLEEY